MSLKDAYIRRERQEYLKMVFAFEAFQAEVANGLFALSGAMIVKDVIVQRWQILCDVGTVVALQIRLT